MSLTEIAKADRISRATVSRVINEAGEAAWPKRVRSTASANP
jgi:DNA-binding LacI/PurR family transcriptional regulator